MNGKKLFVFMFATLLFLASASAATVVAGKIYNADFSATIADATVQVTCNNITKETMSESDGSYAVKYAERRCEDGSMVFVEAYKDDLTGMSSGVVQDDLVPGLDIAVVNVPLIPEFGLMIGGLTAISAIAVFFMVRRA